MECETAYEHLGAWVDRQLSPEQAAALEAHLSTCAECRGAAEALRIQDADLLRAFAPRREAARRLAAAVIAKLNDAEPVRERQLAVTTGAPSGRKWLSLALAAAAGFLFALVLFRPWKHPATEVPPIVAESPPAAQPLVAKLVTATGDVQVRAAGEADWQTTAPLGQFVCTSNGVVRTGPNVRCEWKTADGCVIRLNGDTQIRFATAGVVEVQRGQIACSSPENACLKVIVPERVATAATWSPTEFMCRPQSSAIAAVGLDGGVQVTSSAGDVTLQTATGAAPLKRGESIRLVDGKILPVAATDPILAASWTAALLIRKGYEDPELAQRVDQLLARMGQSKAALLYEEEIRALGEYAVLPLLKFVESPLSQDDHGQRLEALRIAADLAPAWAIPDLIRLLGDADAETRFLAAQALRRLTGHDHGRSPDEWRDELNRCEPTIELWRTWWQQEQTRFAPRKPDQKT